MNIFCSHKNKRLEQGGLWGGGGKFPPSLKEKY